MGEAAELRKLLAQLGETLERLRPERETVVLLPGSDEVGDRLLSVLIRRILQEKCSTGKRDRARPGDPGAGENP